MRLAIPVFFIFHTKWSKEEWSGPLYSTLKWTGHLYWVCSALIDCLQSQSAVLGLLDVFFFLFFSYCDWGGWFHTNKVVPKIPILAQLDNLLSQLCDDHNHSNYTTKIIMVITIVVIVSIKRLWDTNVFSKRNLLYLYSCRDQYADFKCENYVNIYSKFCQILFSSIPKKVCFEKCVVWNFGILQA